MKESSRIAFDKALEQSHMRVIGESDVIEGRLAQLACVLIEAYGEDENAFMLIKPVVRNSQQMPPDILLYHPKTHFVVFIIRTLDAKSIKRGNEGELYTLRKGIQSEVNLTQQIGELAVDVSSVIKKQFINQKSPYVNHVLVLSEINVADWEASNLAVDEITDMSIFLAEDIETKSAVQERLGHLLNNIEETSAISIPRKRLDAIRRAFGDNAVINERRPHRDVKEGTFGRYLDEVHALEKSLSDEQQSLSRIDVNGVPRLFRGVAGSGKSIVLANQVTNYLTRQKQLFDLGRALKVAVICFNRALVPMLQTKIKDAYNAKTQMELPESLTVSHINGFFYLMSKSRGGVLDYVSISEEPDPEKRAAHYLEQIDTLKKHQPDTYDALLFDAVFVDEGQDLTPNEFRFLLEMTRADSKTTEKSFVIFYDDAQNLYARPRPNWKQIGLEVSKGRARVLRQCFRNTFPVINTAFNVLLGTKSENKNVATRTFADIAYLKQQKLIDETDSYVRVNFAKRDGPAPFLKEFADRQSEKDWIVHEVLRLVEHEQVRPEDILILFRQSSDFEDLEESIRQADHQQIIKGFIKPYGNNRDRDAYIFQTSYLTLSTIHGAKGYDAMVIFLIGVDLFEDTPQDRAAFYVGATRSKLALYLTGIEKKGKFLNEVKAILSDTSTPTKQVSEAVRLCKRHGARAIIQYTSVG